MSSTVQWSTAEAYNETTVFDTDLIKLTVYYKCSLTTPRWFGQIIDSILVACMS